MAVPVKSGDHQAVWNMLNAALVFFMQVGFYCLESSYVKELYIHSVVMKNIQDTFLCSAVFLAFGFSLAYGSSWLGVVGDAMHILLINTNPSEFANVFFQTGFCVAACTIVSGAALERMKNKVYVVWVLFVAVFQYPLVAHWVWNTNGWLKVYGFTDFAGASVVHLTGALSSAVACYYLGPRIGQLDPYERRLRSKTPARSLKWLGIGVLFLWFGWFGFNAGSFPVNEPSAAERIGRAFLNTLLGPAVSGSFGLVYMQYRDGFPDPGEMLNLILVGLVSVTGGAGNIAPWSAAIVGLIGAPIYFVSSNFVRFNRWFAVDDPLDVITIHGLCGAWSILAVGIFQIPDPANNLLAGVIYGESQLFYVQMFGLCTIIAVNFFASTLCYVLCSYVLFRKDTLHVELMDIYFGTKLFKADLSATLFSMLTVHDSASHKLLNIFHHVCHEDGWTDALDCLLAIVHIKTICQDVHSKAGKQWTSRAPTMLITDVRSFLNTFFADSSNKEIGLNDKMRLNFQTLKLEGKRHSVGYVFQLFDTVWEEIFRMLLPYFDKFMEEVHECNELIKQGKLEQMTHRKSRREGYERQSMARPIRRMKSMEHPPPGHSPRITERPSSPRRSPRSSPRNSPRLRITNSSATRSANETMSTTMSTFTRTTRTTESGPNQGYETVDQLSPKGSDDEKREMSPSNSLDMSTAFSNALGDHVGYPFSIQFQQDVEQLFEKSIFMSFPFKVTAEFDVTWATDRRTHIDSDDEDEDEEDVFFRMYELNKKCSQFFTAKQLLGYVVTIIPLSVFLFSLNMAFRNKVPVFPPERVLTRHYTLLSGILYTLAANVSTICCIFTAIATLKNAKDAENEIRSSAYLVWISSMAYCGAAAFFYQIPEPPFSCNVIVALNWVLYALMKATLPIYYMMTIEVPFRGSALKFGRRTMKATRFLLFLVYGGFGALFAFIFRGKPFRDRGATTCAPVTDAKLVIAFFIMDAAVGFIFLFLFLDRLKQTLDMFETSRLKALFQKYGNLSTIGILSSITISLFAVVLGIQHILFPLDIIIRSLCVYLIFNVHSDVYDACCGPFTRIFFTNPEKYMYATGSHTSGTGSQTGSSHKKSISPRRITSAPGALRKQTSAPQSSNNVMMTNLNRAPSLQPITRLDSQSSYFHTPTNSVVFTSGDIDVGHPEMERSESPHFPDQVILGRVPSAETMTEFEE